MDGLPAFDPLLVDRFARGNGTVFVGAGVSLGSRLPTWRKLVEPLQQNLGPEADEFDPLQIAELYEAKYGRIALIQHLKEQLGHVKYQLNKTHELLVSLPVPRIYTTNFDHLLEQASQKKQINRNVIYNASHVGLSDTSQLSIVKLHGDLADPMSIVITARDFYSYAAKNPAVADLLKVELQTRTVLFIGYSFSDPNLAMILANAVTQTGNTSPPIYALQFRPSQLAIKAMKARGVNVIPIEAAPGSIDAEKMVESWLGEFHRLINSFERRRMQGIDARRQLTERFHVARPYSVKCAPICERIRNGLSSDFRVIVVKGEAGVGKTHLVADAAMGKLQPHSRALRASGDFEQIVWIRRVYRENGAYHTLEQIFSVITGQVDTNLPGGDIDSGPTLKKIDALLQERRLLVVIEDLDDPRADATMDGHQQQSRKKHFDEIKQWLEEASHYAYPRSRIVVTTRTASVAGYVVDVERLESCEALRMVEEHARAIALRRKFKEPFDQASKERIAARTLGNPQAIRLALGLLNGTADLELLKNVLDRLDAKSGIETVFGELIKGICEQLENAPVACSVAETMAAFPAEEWVPAEQLKCAAETESVQPDREAIQKCVDLGLIEHDVCRDSFFMHRTTKEALHLQPGKVGFSPASLNAARLRLADCLLKFLGREDVARRSDIPEVYWNALVRDEMVKIDPLWPIIESVMWWAEERPIIVDYLLLLVHYMDSRFYNGQRLVFVKRAIAALEVGRLREPNEDMRRIEALLHIDALGWTYIEEGSEDTALEHIRKGEELLGDAPAHSDLRALASVWRARIAVRQGNTAEANKHIDSAKEQMRLGPEKAWIKARVSMIAGDVRLTERAPDEALALYREAEASEETYGGEVGYQIDPRVGFALLSKADAEKNEKKNDKENCGKEKCDKEKSDKEKNDKENKAINDAILRFTRLAENEHVSTGRLYGDYGLALIAARKDSTGEALRQLRTILNDIAARQGGNNVLLKLAKDSYETLARK